MSIARRAASTGGGGPEAVWLRPVGALLVVLWLGLMAPQAAWGVADTVPAGDDAVPVAVRCDAQMVAEQLAARRVVQRPARPGLQAYLNDLSMAVAEGLASILGRVAPGFNWLGRFLGSLDARLFFGLLVLVLVVLLVLVLARRRDGDPAERPAVVQAQHETPHQTIDWRARLEKHLAAGDAVHALEALWWWLAHRLVPGAVDPAWTGRELVLAGGRSDLLRAVRTLDRLTYDAAVPELRAVRDLLHHLEQQLPVQTGASP